MPNTLTHILLQWWNVCQSSICLHFLFKLWP